MRQGRQYLIMSNGTLKKTEMKGDTSRYMRRAEAKAKSRKLRRAKDKVECASVKSCGTAESSCRRT